MRCPYFDKAITLPARSRNCTTHYQPFDATSFITASLMAKTTYQRWHCPICKKPAFDFLIDEYLLELIGGRTNISDITFSIGAKPVIKTKNYSCEESDLDKSQVKEGIESNVRSKQLNDLERRVSKKEITVYDVIDSEEEEMNLKRLFTKRDDSMEI